ncbi:hypothetical protein E3N88_32256 [Mikania micrantha]|uniref:Uncharacterized protein n=1 Tax=Mikania micrantha TaxID=192012 RepID=A0A5N6M8G5_9ASTR|nr:hypothetical protein E3N88_32256 [Mikania micrantha]
MAASDDFPAQPLHLRRRRRGGANPHGGEEVEQTLTAARRNLGRSTWPRAVGVEVGHERDGGRRRWESGGVALAVGVSARKKKRLWKEEEVGRPQEELGPRLRQEEAAQTFFNEMSARKQTVCEPLTSSRVCVAQT